MTSRSAVASTASLLQPALRAAVDGLPPSMRRIAGYHLGWLDEEGRPAEGDHGKAIRPTLTLLAAEAIGGSASAAVPAAVAIELVHNFSLIHDDVMDGDDTRRHRPTVWRVFGLGSAILVGDALLTLAFDVLGSSEHPAAREGARRLSGAVMGMVDGQYADMSFEQRADVDMAECVAMAERKTAALFGTAAALGGAFGGAQPQQVDDLAAFGTCLGVAFQIVDDLLGIWGDPGVTGKPVYSDLQNRKKSLPVVAALESGTPAGRELATMYASAQPLSGPELVNAARLLDVAGAHRWSVARVDELLADALAHLEAAVPHGRAASELRSLAHHLVRRDH